MVDFDGSLAAIVDDPEGAVPVAGAVGVLEAAVEHFGLVGVISGRPVGFLRDRLPVPGLTLVGQYGMERWRDGGVVVDDRAIEFVAVIAELAFRADAELPGIYVERKGQVAVTLHWRRRPAMESETQRWAAAAAQQYAVAVYPTRMAVELRPPIPVDKGAALAELVAGLEAALFAGDDHGDLSAFATLGRLRDEGRLDRIVRVAVHSDEEPAELRDRTDIGVDGPAGLVAFLRKLVARG